MTFSIYQLKIFSSRLTLEALFNVFIGRSSYDNRTANIQ
jgi:hypothetical protein